MPETTRTNKLTIAVALFAFTVLAFVIHGYHYGIEDEAIYLPAIKKILDPSLYPRDSEFFMGQARGTALPWIIAGLTRLTHAPLPWVVLAAQFASIYAFLLGCWMIASRCFATARQPWAGVGLVTALLTLPIAGTSIYIVDQHLHPRTLASAFVLMAIAFALSRRAFACVMWCALALVIHPLMALYGIAFVVVLWLPLERWTGSRRRVADASTIVAGLVALPFLARPTAAWREALATREYYTLRNWEWYEWLGLLAPMLIVWWLARVCEKHELWTAAHLLRRLNLYATLMCMVTIAVTVPRATEFLWPLQPARYLHTVFLLMILVGAGLAARRSVWLVATTGVILAAVMCFVQVSEFRPQGAGHLDIPGRTSQVGYVQAFLWVRDHTPKDAYFALDPEYMRYSDNYGFRALAERSQMADISKDAGPVTVAPQLASEWKRQVDALRGWEKFTISDFVRLRRDFGVEWVIVNSERGAPSQDIECPFIAVIAGETNAAVCRTPSVDKLGQVPSAH